MTIIRSEIEKVWEVEREILDVFHEVCVSNGLRYTLAYGTLLGAVRHGGFIPWDDDIDLIMPREDYEKLLEIWNEAAPKEYILQNICTNPDYVNTFSKIRKDKTTFLQYDFERDATFHKGIFIDIFPADRVADGKISNKLQFIACAVHLLYTRGHTSGSGGVIGFVERMLLRLPAAWHPVLRRAAENVIKKWNGKSGLRWFVPCTIGCAKLYYPSDLFGEMKTISFEKKDYLCVADPDAVLRTDYGDYMQLPPEEERTWQHHPIVLDFEHNFEEL